MGRQDSDADKVAQEWGRILDMASAASPFAVVFAQNEISEVLPRPTPLSLSLMQALWASGGSVELACSALNLTYPLAEGAAEYPVILFGRLYVDKREELARSLQINPMAARRLRKSADAIETHFREHFLAEFLSEVSLLEAIHFDQLTTSELTTAIARIGHSFVTRTHVEVDVINIAADFFLREAKNKLVAANLEPLSYLAPVGPNAFECVLSEALAASAVERNNILLKGLGHRAALDYELSMPRYAEQFEKMHALCAMPLPSAETGKADRELTRDCSDKSVLQAVRIARRFQTLKEDAKHHSLRELAVMRRAVVELDRRLGLDGLAFHLTLKELDALRSETLDTLRNVAAERRADAARFAGAPTLPAKLTVIDIENASAGLSTEDPDRVIGGTWVSGRAVVEGRACVVGGSELEKMTSIPGFRDGDIVVSTMGHPHGPSISSGRAASFARSEAG